MRNQGQSGGWYVVAVLVTVASFVGCNALWNYTDLNDYFPYDLAVDLLAGSGVALGFLAWALRTDRLTCAELGLALTGWTAPRRLLTLAMVLICTYVRIAPVWEAHPQFALWGDYAIWFVLLLGSNLAELLVFVGVGFCLTERGLRQGGLPRFAAAGLAGLLAAVSFGLFHFTYPPLWYGLVVPLMGVMFLNVVLFVLTRNFYLTLVLHSAFAATGFLKQQYAGYLEIQMFLAGRGLALSLCAFSVPFLILHLLEWAGRDEPRAIS